MSLFIFRISESQLCSALQELDQNYQDYQNYPEQDTDGSLSGELLFEEAEDLTELLPPRLDALLSTLAESCGAWFYCKNRKILNETLHVVMALNSLGMEFCACKD